jgi:hypothetical protein
MKKIWMVLIGLALLPQMAYACGEMDGLRTLLFFVYVAVPAAVIHLLLTFYFAGKGKYASAKFANLHVMIACITPAVWLVIALLDASGKFSKRTEELLVVFGLCLVIVLLAFTPVFIHKRQLKQAARLKS